MIRYLGITDHFKLWALISFFNFKHSPSYYLYINLKHIVASNRTILVPNVCLHQITQTARPLFVVSRIQTFPTWVVIINLFISLKGLHTIYAQDIQIPSVEDKTRLPLAQRLKGWVREIRRRSNGRLDIVNSSPSSTCVCCLCVCVCKLDIEQVIVERNVTEWMYNVH